MQPIMTDQSDNQTTGDEKPRRRKRYSGSHPRRFEQRYKELSGDADMIQHIRERRRTPAGAHVPVLMSEVVEALAPRPGDIVADCTLGYGGHATALAQAVQPGGRVIGFDIDAKELARTKDRLTAAGLPISVHHANFAGIAKVMGQEGLDGYDIIFADLGVSSMQIDDPARGMSYRHDNAPLDMRMDSRRQRTAADLLASLSPDELSAALWELADEPDHEEIAQQIVAQRNATPLTTIGQLKELIFTAKGTSEAIWKKQSSSSDGHPAMRTFQALRILVNDELSAIRQLLRLAPHCLRPGGRIGIISFHSGEDRLVKQAFRDGLRQGVYEAQSDRVIRATSQEAHLNPRSNSAKLRWARRAGA
jgi:16S rRNA (cytosine1402-N4)-methyltransferase